MRFLYSVQTFSKSRFSWLLLLAIIVCFEATALYFEHVMLLAPCVMCIYERVAMLGITGAALLGSLAPGNSLVRWLGLIGWGFSAYRGLSLSIEHVNYQFNPSPFKTCDIFVSFPDWLPLNKWVPWMFEAYGDCSKVVWEFLSLSMPQWLVIIFAGNLIALGVIIVAQFVSKPRMFG